MRRRLLLVALWLAGTVGATTVVFVAVSRLSSDLANVSQKNDVLAGKGSTITQPSTSVAGTSVVTTAVAPTVPATTVPEPTTEATTVVPVTEQTAPEIGTPTTVGGRPTPTASPRTTSGSAPGPVVPPPTAPPPTATTPTTPPPVTTSPPPVTTSPPATGGSGCFSDSQRVGRAGNIFYAACSNGITLLQVTPASQAWGYTVGSGGPPTVSVTFTSGSTSITCTISGTNEGVNKLGAC